MSPKSAPGVPEEAVEAICRRRYPATWQDMEAHRAASIRCDVREELERALPAILSQHNAEIRERLELNVLCSELRHIAEKGCTPNASDAGLAVDVLTWAEGWLLQLTAALSESPEDREGER